MRKNPIVRWIAIVGVVSILCLVGSSSVQAGRCFSAAIDAPIFLPGGEHAITGMLTLCVTRELSPVSALHKTYVDGNPVAMLVSRRGYSEGTDDGRPFMMFNRDDLGRLHLYGFAVPSGGRMVTYHVANELRFVDSRRFAKNESHSDMARPAQTETLSTVLVSAVGPSNGR